jgi:hypothetical protein
MKNDLQIYLNRVNAYHTYNPELFTEFRDMVKQCHDKLRSYQLENISPMSEVWLIMGIDEISKELSNRINDDFLSLSMERQKTEFMFTKSTISLVLTNIIMHL